MHEISHNVSDASHNSHERTNTITDVAEVIQHTMDRAIQVEDAAEELASLADQLQQLVSTFRI